MTNSFGVAIIVDLEGCAGITRFRETYEHADDFELARRRMTAELNAAVEGAIEGGVDRQRIFAIDIHWDGRSLLPDEVHPDCLLLRGGRFPSYRSEVYRRVDAIAYLGLYAPAGHPGVLAHTYDFHVQSIKINGEEWGDAEIECLIAAQGDNMRKGAVPILAAGDQHALVVFRQRFPEVIGVQTKEAIDASSAICEHPLRVNEKIRTQMAVACELFGKNRKIYGEPARFEVPMRVSIGFATSEMADAVASLLGETDRGASNEVRRLFVEPTGLAIANWVANAVMIARAADDGRGGS
jgi:D-amino peptidase